MSCHARNRSAARAGRRRGDFGTAAARVTALFVALLLPLTVTGTAHASADPESGLAVAVSGTESAPLIVLTNKTSAPCQVPDVALGSVAFTKVEQGGKTVPPVSAAAWFDDSVPDYLGSRLRTLAPGQSISVPMPIVTTAETGPALETASWTDVDSSTADLYPVKAGQPVTVTVNYAPAIIAPAGVTLCPAAGSPATATLTAAGVSGPGAAPGASAASAAGSAEILGLSRTLFLGVAAGVVVLVLVAVFLFIMLRRRRHRPTDATANVLILLALVATSLVPVTASVPKAAATVTVGSGSLSKPYATCNGTFQGAGGDPSSILPTLAAGGANVQIVDANGDQNHEIILPGGQIIIFWNPSDTHAYVGGGNADPCSTLYHEMDHAYQDLTGGQTHTHCWTAGSGGKLVDSGIPTNEVQATREQNQLRANLGLPQRTTYGDKPLPSGTCQPPPKNPPNPNCTGEGCGDSNGDPHLRTFTGVRYDFQAAGEFVAADDPRGGFQIQVRQQAYPGSRTVAVNTAIAMDVAGDRVQVGIGSQGLLLLVNSVPQATTTLPLPHGGSLATGFTAAGETLTVTWPDSSSATISQIGLWGLHLAVRPAAAHAGHLRGLLGDLGGGGGGTGVATGVQAANGTTITDPTYATLYPAFADGWRVTAATSLFAYAPGTSTATYTDRSFPGAPATSSSIPDPAAAEAQCAAAGITDPVTLKDCEFDVGLTGQSAFATADAASQPPQGPPPPTQDGGSFGIDGAAATVRITAANGSTVLHFAGTAGEAVFVNVPTATLPPQCGVLELDDPSGKQLNEGCIIGGAGYIPQTKLPVTGTYSIKIGPTGAGTATVRVVQDFDQKTGISPGGPTVTATIGQPGAAARMTFAVPPGTRVFVEVSDSTLPSQCGGLDLIGPNDTSVASGCVINGTGDIDTTTIQASGTYTILLNPTPPATGSAVFRLFTDRDRQAAITVGGPPQTAVIAQPGERAVFSFQGTAGETVGAQASGSTLPDECGDFSLYAPDGTELSRQCIVSGNGTIPATKLPSNGTYQLVVDPSDTGTGSVVVRLTGG